jgi:hypothetical protein
MERTPGIKETTSPYYQAAKKVPLSSWVSNHTRTKMFELFMYLLKPTAESTLLDVGVTSDTHFQESNFLERLYPYKEKITCVGTEDGKYLESQYPGLRFTQVKPGESLPFSDRSFDIVFSNAVVEHAGSKIQQEFFIRELIRVSKQFFITTPNRWFPVETHTAIPLIHWLSKPLFRWIFTRIGQDYWAKEENLNLLDRKALERIFPFDVHPQIKFIKTFGWNSNIIAFGFNPLVHKE